jgi:hypothetical protein
MVTKFKKTLFFILLTIALIAGCNGNNDDDYYPELQGNIYSHEDSLDAQHVVECPHEIECEIEYPDEQQETPHPEHADDLEHPIPHWQVALEEFLSEFLSIFTPRTTIANEWSEWEVGGWWRFVRECVYIDQDGWERPIFYLVNPITEELVDADAEPYVLVREGIDYDGTEWELTFIADSFYLQDVDGDDIPELFISWVIIDGSPFGFVSMFRYMDGGYEPLSVSRRYLQHWREDTLNSPILFNSGASIVGELLAMDSEGRILALGMGGAGGIESSANIFKLNNNGVVLEPIFHMRYGNIWDDINDPEWGFRLYVDESIKNEHVPLLEVDSRDVMFFPSEWFEGGGDMTPVQLPVLPHITVLPLPRMTELEESIIERITARLTQEGRIISVQD